MADQGSSSQENVSDVIVIGGGPAGLGAAIYSARARFRTLALDKNPFAGALARAEKIYNYPGLTKVVPGAELISLFRNHAESLGAEVLQQEVIGIDFKKYPFEIITLENTYMARSVIIATGAMGRKPSIQGEAEFLGRGVSYCATCDAAFFREQAVAVLGDLPEIEDEIALVKRAAGRIYCFTKGGELPEYMKDEKKIELLRGYRVTDIRGRDVVEAIAAVDPSGNERVFTVAGVFIYLHGTSPITDFLAGSLELTPQGCLKVNHEEMSTSVEGVYAAGDVTCKRIRQAVIAVAEGCVASISAGRFVSTKARKAK